MISIEVFALISGSADPQCGYRGVLQVLMLSSQRLARFAGWENPLVETVCPGILRKYLIKTVKNWWSRSGLGGRAGRNTGQSGPAFILAPGEEM
jgi:hypothetical protein